MIPLSVPEIRGNEWKYVKECLDTGWVSSAGAFVDLFQEKFREYVGSKKAIATINGTAALHLALLSLGVGEGDEVIVPSMTFIAPVNAVKYVGAEPVFADVCRDTYVMDTQRIEELITHRTKAILPVHIYGHPVDMDVVMEISKKYKLYVIEDATESLGSLYKGKHTGTIGHVGCFSFNGNKLITAGNGGMLVTNDESAGECALYLSTQAKSARGVGGFSHEEIGYNYRMSNINAAVGLGQMENIGAFIDAKKRNASIYLDLLSDIEGIKTPVSMSWAENVHWLYSILVEDGYKESREELIGRLKQSGIETRPFFMPVHLMPPYEKCKCGNLKVTMELSRRGLNLPSSVGLTQDKIRHICSLIAHVQH